MFLYGEDIRPYTYLFVSVIVASTTSAVSTVLSYVCTLMRIIIPQSIAGVLGIISSIALSYGMIKNAENPMMSTMMVIIIATAVYSLAELILIAYKVNKMEEN